MSLDNSRVLLIDDEDFILHSYKSVLASKGLSSVLTLQDARDALPVIEQNKPDVIVIDLLMPYISGMDLLRAIKQNHSDIPVIVMTGLNDIENAVECMKEGAFDYLLKPVDIGRFMSSINRAIEFVDLRDEVKYLRQHILTDKLENEGAFKEIITNDRKMLSIFCYLEAIVKTRRPVLICGETGVGKELIARAIYALCNICGKFVSLNVAGLDDTIFSDTLFGHTRGSFTGADTDRDGLIVQASDGMLFLDEIGDLSQPSQLKLLRLLEEKIYYKIGSDEPMCCNALIIASTNRDIVSLVSEGKFRKDLYYRLCSHSVYVPPLRERLDDIPLLLEHFLETAAASLNRKKIYFPVELITLLTNYNFPGNIRELQGMVFDAVAQHRSGLISLLSFKSFISKVGKKLDLTSIPGQDNIIPVHDNGNVLPTLKESEDYLITEALIRSNGNQGIAASILGISRQALNKRLKRREINTESTT